MKEIILIVKDNCIACDAVEQMLENICTNNSNFKYTVTNNNILKVNIFIFFDIFSIFYILKFII